MAAKLSDHNKVLLDLVSVCLVYIAIYLAYVSINYIVKNARIEKKFKILYPSRTTMDLFSTGNLPFGSFVGLKHLHRLKG